MNSTPPHPAPGEGEKTPIEQRHRDLANRLFAALNGSDYGQLHAVYNDRLSRIIADFEQAACASLQVEKSTYHGIPVGNPFKDLESKLDASQRRCEELEAENEMQSTDHGMDHHRVQEALRNTGLFTDEQLEGPGPAAQIPSIRDLANLACSRLTAAERELAELRKDKARLKWLHSGGWEHRPGWQWGVAEIQFDRHGQVVSAFWGLSDSSDIDEAMAREASETAAASAPDAPKPPKNSR